MQSQRSSLPASAPLGSPGPRRRRLIVTRRHLPPLRLVPGDSAAGDGRPPSAGELVADVMALIDAGLIAAVDSDTCVRCARVPDDGVVANVAGNKDVAHDASDPVRAYSDAKAG
jgi:hypothetical protein